MAVTPQIPPQEICELRLDLIQEELDELAEAFADADVVDAADALGDLLYVVLGAACACGIDIAPVFAEIHRSNMSKIEGMQKRDDGKILKGPNFVYPNLTPILEAQGWKK